MINTRISAGFNKVQELKCCCNVTDIKLHMAKNEGESCVISVVSDKKLENAVLEVEKGNNGFTVEVEKEHFVSCNGVNWPDALEPVKNFDIEANELTNILVRFTTTVNTEAGRYTFILALKDGDGNIVCNYTVRIKVWNFALPEKYVINTAMGLSRVRISEKHGVTDPDELQRLYEKYYEFLLKFRVSAYDMPYNALDDRADKYMSDPRVTSFVLDIDKEVDDETLKKYHAKLSTNPEWMKKATFYPLDEPLNKEHLGMLIAKCERIKRLCPGVRRVSPFFRNIQFTKDTDEIEILLEHCEVLCPKITCFNDKFIYRLEEQKEKYGSFQSRMDKAREEGKEVWQYVCWEPGKPYLNMYVDESGLDHRILFWQQHMVGATGFLYWATTTWRSVKDPWTNMATMPQLSPNVFGDGALLYNGNKVGIDGPCGSVRLDAVRDGMEDCEMLRMADEVLGRDWVLAKVKAVTMDLMHYTESGDFFTAVRNEIGNELEKALNK